MLKSRDTKNQSGFTLIESAIAVIILSVGILTMVRFFPYSLQIIGDSQNKTVASHIGMEKIEFLNDLTYEEINTGTLEPKQKISQDPNDYRYGFERETIVEYVNNHHQETQSDMGLKKISVTVFWRNAVRIQEQTFTIQTIRSDY